MDINHKYTPQTWPKHPEQATLEGKNKVVGFWIFLACEVVLFASLFATYIALKNSGPAGMEETTKKIIQKLGLSQKAVDTESNLIETPLPAIFHIVAAHCGCHIFLCGFLTVDELVLYPHDSGDTTSFNLSNASDRITFP